YSISLKLITRCQQRVSGFSRIRTDRGKFEAVPSFHPIAALQRHPTQTQVGQGVFKVVLSQKIKLLLSPVPITMFNESFRQLQSCTIRVMTGKIGDPPVFGG